MEKTTTELRRKLHECCMEWKDQSTVHERSTAISTAVGWVFAYTMNDNLGTLDVEIDSITPDQVLDVVRALNPTSDEFSIDAVNLASTYAYQAKHMGH